MHALPPADFWHLIDQAATAAPAASAAQAQHLVQALAARPLADSIGFELTLRQLLIEADDYGLLGVLKILDGHVTDDSYLSFRCWLIGQGEAVFRAALQQPDSLVTVVPGPYECDFEPLLLVATDAYARQTGRTEDDSFPRAVALAQGLDYGFDAPPTTGTDWEEEDLPKLLPRLWKKFR